MVLYCRNVRSLNKANRRMSLEIETSSEQPVSTKNFVVQGGFIISQNLWYRRVEHAGFLILDLFKKWLDPFYANRVNIV